MTSSDERREVAEKLREDASCSESTPREVFESYLGIEYDGEDVFEESYKSESLLRVADLIDPTCEVKDDNRLTSDFAYVCRTCGEHFSTCNKPNYCPGCGARVVREGDA
jgi:rubrerythrin